MRGKLGTHLVQMKVTTGCSALTVGARSRGPSRDTDPASHSSWPFTAIVELWTDLKSGGGGGEGTTFDSDGGGKERVRARAGQERVGEGHWRHGPPRRTLALCTHVCRQPRPGALEQEGGGRGAVLEQRGGHAV